MPRTRLLPNYQKTLPRVDGKVFVITGTTSGTGFAAARVIALLGGETVLLNRPSERSKAALAKLKEAAPEGKFVPIDCDLQNFDSVRKAATQIKSNYSKVYCLSNNAGIMATADKATSDGYDTQMQTNHLSHFLLTKELFPLIQAASEEYGDARIVNHSSLGRAHTPNKGLEAKYFGKNGGNLGGDEVKGLMGGASFHRYFQTKLANSVFTYALDNKLKAKSSKVRAIACHPGGSSTSLGDHLRMGFGYRILMNVVSPFLMQTADDGAMGLIMGMVDPKAESGKLYGPKNNGTKGKAVVNPPESYENDPKQMEMLWKLSEEAIGEQFTI